MSTTNDTSRQPFHRRHWSLELPDGLAMVAEQVEAVLWIVILDQSGEVVFDPYVLGSDALN